MTEQINETSSAELEENTTAYDQESAEEGSSPDSTDDRGDTRWQEGDEVTLVRVRFPGNSRSFPFLVGKRHFRYGQKVVAMSDRGMDVGYINSFPYTVKFKKSMLPIRSINKVAEQSDIEEMQGNLAKQKEAQGTASKLVSDLGLDMQITHVEIIQFGKKMVFYFTAPARVDFRDLVKRLVSELKMRIELRQITVRDRAAALGSIGACGQATCCSTFLKNYGNVSIKMAKNQNLALIPSKINGVCGQIKCCIKYEDDVYADKRKLLPREGNYLKTLNGDIGKVTKLHILVEQFDMITEKGQIRRYTKSQFHEGKKLPKDHPFPDRFQHVVNETSNIIGLDDAASEMAKNFNHGLSEDEIAQKNLASLSENSDDTFFEHARDKMGDISQPEQPAKDSSNEEDKTESSEPRKKSKGRRNNNRRRRPKSDDKEASSQNPKDSQKGSGEKSGEPSKKPQNKRRRNRRPKKKPDGQQKKPQDNS